ncbi:hypothetical protein ACQPZG_05100 (plasmid) [Streptomyces sp. CA-294286]|uniref:hypothetical protein n=1 Tax=Streptomyces sp. CA-294286 TaxID=3240070 RepID=UPI003D8C72B0
MDRAATEVREGAADRVLAVAVRSDAAFAVMEVCFRYALAARWNGRLPDRWLNDISAAWGVGALL